MSGGAETRPRTTTRTRTRTTSHHTHTDYVPAVKSTPPRLDDVAYLDTAESVDRWMRGIASADLVALDTEGASFHRFVDRIYLLQISTRAQTAVIDPLPIGSPSGLGALLESADTEVVFHDADYDLRLLWQDYGWHVRRIFDTRVAAQLLGIRAFGLAALLERFFGVKLDKKHQRADWSMRPLSRDMLEYAARDTMHLCELRDRLKDELDRRGRLSWAAEEFARLEGTRWEEDPPGTAFLRMKGARDLVRRDLAVLRELVGWREAVARAQDRATFRVVGNEALLDLARLKPQTRDELAGVKGIGRGLLDSRSRELLDAIGRGLQVPEAELPRFPRTLRWDRDADFDSRVNALRAARDAVSDALDLDPGVLCPRDRLEAIARVRPQTIDALSAVPGVRRWQAEVLGERFLRAMN